jgi:hypothetical protein
LLQAGHAAQREIGDDEEDGLQRIEALGQGEVAVSVTQQAQGEQCWQGADHAAVGHIISGFKARLCALQQAQSSSDALHRARGAHPHERLTIGDAARALRGGNALRGGIGKS